VSHGHTRSQSFIRHLEPLQGALEAYCRRALHDRNAIEDTLQTAVRHAFRDFHLYVEGTSFRTWMFHYLHLEILNCNRKHARTRTVELPADLSVEDVWQIAVDEPLFRVLIDDPEPLLEECDDALAGAIAELAETPRAVFLLHAVGEFKYREIAEILDVPLGTVMSTLSRARLHIRQRLVQYGEDRGLLKRDAQQDSP